MVAATLRGHRRDRQLAPGNGSVSRSKQASPTKARDRAARAEHLSGVVRPCGRSRALLAAQLQTGGRPSGPAADRLQRRVPDAGMAGADGRQLPVSERFPVPPYAPSEHLVKPLTVAPLTIGPETKLLTGQADPRDPILQEAGRLRTICSLRLIKLTAKPDFAFENQYVRR